MCGWDHGAAMIGGGDRWHTVELACSAARRRCRATERVRLGLTAGVEKMGTWIMSSPEKPQAPARSEQMTAARQMHELITRSLLVQAVFVASRLRIPDLLGDGAMTADELAGPTGAQPAALHRLLRALTGLDVLTCDGDRFALTALGQSLRSGPHSAAESARFLGSRFVWSAWGALGDAIMDGQAAFRHAHDTDMFHYLGTHPDALGSFHALMSSQSQLQTAAVLAGCDFSAARTVVDVGGGHGALLAAVLQANPGRPRAPLRPAGRGSRFRSPARPGRPTMHGCPWRLLPFRPGRGRHLSTQARPARLGRRPCRTDPAQHPRRHHRLHDDEPAVIMEAVMPPGDGYHHAKFLDLNMLVLAEGGRERTEEEYRRLLDQAGFDIARTVATASPLSVIEAVPR